MRLACEARFVGCTNNAALEIRHGAECCATYLFVLYYRLCWTVSSKKIVLPPLKKKFKQLITIMLEFCLEKQAHAVASPLSADTGLSCLGFLTYSIASRLIRPSVKAKS